MAPKLALIHHVGHATAQQMVQARIYSESTNVNLNDIFALVLPAEFAFPFDCRLALPERKIPTRINTRPVAKKSNSKEIGIGEASGILASSIKGKLLTQDISVGLPADRYRQLFCQKI
jgi:hypothetical protein